jgi:hypothetical protein
MSAPPQANRLNAGKAFLRESPEIIDTVMSKETNTLPIAAVAPAFAIVTPAGACCGIVDLQ